MLHDIGKKTSILKFEHRRVVNIDVVIVIAEIYLDIN